MRKTLIHAALAMAMLTPALGQECPQGSDTMAAVQEQIQAAGADSKEYRGPIVQGILAALDARFPGRPDELGDVDMFLVVIFPTAVNLGFVHEGCVHNVVLRGIPTYVWEQILDEAQGGRRS